MRQSDDDETLTPAAFALVLAEVFYGEPWNDVEPYAARAWSQLPGTKAWEEIRDTVLHCFERLKVAPL